MDQGGRGGGSVLCVLYCECVWLLEERDLDGLAVHSGERRGGGIVLKSYEQLKDDISAMRWISIVRTQGFCICSNIKRSKLILCSVMFLINRASRKSEAVNLDIYPCNNISRVKS